MRQVAAGTVELHSRAELLDVVTKDGQACGIVTRDLVSGEVTPHSAHAVVLATGGYGNVYFLSTNAMMCNVTAAWRAHRKGALFANPCYTQIHPTCIPASDDFQSKLTLMSESLRNDGRIWVPNGKADSRSAADIPETERDYYLERKYPAFGNLVPRDVASRNAKTVVDEGHGVGPLANGVYLDFSAAIARDGLDAISEKYGNLFDMYQRITGENPYQTPMRIYPATHYTMGGLWVDYNLMTNVEGLYAIGEANFSDHGANRLGASALMQGLADGYFVLPYTIGDGLAGQLGNDPVPTSDPVFTQAVAGINDTNRRWLATNGTKSVDHYHRELGRIVWDNIGMARNKAGLQQAVTDIPALKEEYHKNVRVLGSADTLNQSLEKAGRVADFFELAELMARDALQREESCGGHFRDEYQTAEGEAQRDDENFAHVAAWEWNGEGTDPTRHQEELTFDNVALSQRSYK
jgi:succinate dehydrogenase / fumarate reductase flavoprotein subunit